MATTFTATDFSLSRRTYVRRIPCECRFCPEFHHSDFPYCSKECLGIDESKVTIGYGSTFIIGNRRCTHIHAKCQVPSCNLSREPDFIDAATQDDWMNRHEVVPRYVQPFCEAHLPKCSCGLSRFTTSKLEMKYPLSEEDSKLFNLKCAKCLHACPVASCKESRFYTKEEDKVELSLSCRSHGSHVLVGQMLIDYKKVVEHFEFLFKADIHSIINELEMFIDGKTLTEYQNICLLSYVNAARANDPVLIIKFLKEVAAVGKLRKLIPQIVDQKESLVRLREQVRNCSQ
ncbi:MAG: hypothetical protein Harvfovirus2_10 [Harvfovirus sp.]|uniref:Uncharacterized protein n=1 Tax=Harvfovirus sp. TaxID=2487768 RepID=A0A3G5A029_9VIRU|nr:MAG: hypothetical protein Harvfovirus2_10 [Harvfovirus sp.]